MSRLREKRETAGLTQKDLAEMVGVHPTAIAAWERGERNPKKKNMRRLADALRTSIYELFPSEISTDNPSLTELIQMPSPFAKHRGNLIIGGKEVDCYVLDTGDRVISLGATVHALTGTTHGNLENYLNVSSLKSLIKAESVMNSTVEFYIPTTGVQFTARGITAETFIEICDAYVTALEQGLLQTDRQREIAIQCSMILRSCAKIGLIALIDEATGFQYERAEDALQIKLKAYIAEEMRQWEKTFPDDLWEELGRLTGWDQPLHLRPRWWGKLVMELIYDALDPDVAEYLRNNAPPPRHGQNYHQWLTENYGLKQLITHIHQIVGIAKVCKDIQELRYKVALHYGRKPMQLTFFYDISEKSLKG